MKSKALTHIIYTNEHFRTLPSGGTQFDYCRDWLYDCKEDYSGSENWGSKYDIPDSLVYDQLAFQDEMNYEDFIDDMKEFLENGGRWMLTGSLGLWTGRHYCHDMEIYQIDHLRRCWEKCDELTVYDGGGHLYFEMSHHDGRNCFELVEITNAGEDYISKNEYDKSDAEIHETIMKLPNLYYRLPHYAKKKWGASEFERPAKVKTLTTTLTSTAGAGAVGSAALAMAN